MDEFIKALEVFLQSSKYRRDEHTEKSAALKKVVKSARDLKNNIERLDAVNQKYSEGDK